MRGTTGIAIGLVLAPLGCSFLFSISDDAASGNHDDAGEGGAGSAESGVLEAFGDAPARTCKQTGRGPMLVNVGDRVCIDATEVTLEQYQGFVSDAGAGSLSGMPERCAGYAADRTRWLVSDAGDVPAFYVGWCDAFAYCAWAGKKLCGAFPGYEQDAGPGPPAEDAGFSHGLVFTEMQNREANSWLWACGGGTRALNYSYGNDFDASAGCTAAGGGFIAVETRRVGVACEGPVRGVFDMVGNVAEWIDACDRDVCIAMGAGECKEVSFHALGYDPLEFSFANSTVQARGIRCCGVDPPAP